MNSQSDPMERLRTLILQSQRGPLSEQEIEELNSLVLAEGGATETAGLLDQLCAFTDSGAFDSLPMTELLSCLHEQEMDATESGYAEVSGARCEVPTLPRRSASESRQSGRSANPVWILVVAASYLVVASLGWSLGKLRLTEGPTPQLSLSDWADRSSRGDQSVSIAPQLVSMTACVWRPSSDPAPAVGESLDSGDSLNLVEGIAELRIGDGTSGEALARIEGPASLYIRADGQLDLLQGSMTIKSVSSGRGRVMVHTSVGRVLVDGMSSIGLVSNGSESEVHLFSGRATVETHQEGVHSSPLALEAGEAIRITAQNEGDLVIVRFDASEDNFVSARSLAFDSLEIGEAYVRSVLDSQPSVYWRFEETKGEYPRYIENLGSAKDLNAIVVGEPRWRQYGENRVAELGMSQSSAFRGLTPWSDKALDSYTIEVWIKPLMFHHGEVICLHDVEAIPDGRYPHTMMLEVTAQHYFTHRLSDSPSNRLRFVHRRLGATQPISATSLFASEPYRPRIWQHVAVQKEGNRQMLWIDGRLSSERENIASLDRDAQILVGQVYPDSVYRRFVGQVDELAIYDRCLSPEELRNHIRAAGRPIAPPTP